MGTERLTAFSDGVIAIIITIMVLELKVPEGADWAAFVQIGPVFTAYVLSFVYLAIYWNNHHHLLHTVTRVDGLILWANSHLLFWLSLVPASTWWLGLHFPAPLPTTIYGVTLLMPGIAYYLLQIAIVHSHGPHSLLASALGSDLKGKISIAFYILGIGLGLMFPWASITLYVLVALIWFIPDRRIENVLRQSGQSASEAGKAPRGTFEAVPR